MHKNLWEHRESAGKGESAENQQRQSQHREAAEKEKAFHYHNRTHSKRVHAERSADKGVSRESTEPEKSPQQSEHNSPSRRRRSRIIDMYSVYSQCKYLTRIFLIIILFLLTAL